MSIELKGNPNYAPLVFTVPELKKLPNSDFLYGIEIAGITAAVNDSWLPRVGQLAVIFPAEAQIDAGLAWSANLHRHANRNRDQSEAGYLEDSRRVRPKRFRGNVSKGLVLPIQEIITYYGEHDFKPGDTFDHVNGAEVSRKYVVPTKGGGQQQNSALAKAFKRVDEAVFPEHVSTSFWLRNLEQVEDDEIIIITQKLHGTSVRFGNVPVKVKKTWVERLAERFGVRVPQFEHDIIAGSRHVIKDPLAIGQKNFYEKDVWGQAAELWGANVPKGFIVYGELTGYVANDTPIQKGFTYESHPDSMDLHVYRVSFVNEDGVLYDLSWDQVRAFTERHGMGHVPELWRGPKAALVIENFTEKNFGREQRKGARYRDEPILISGGGTGKDEGIVVRRDRGGQVPDFYKFKNDSFYLHEAEELDAGEENIEG